MSKKLKASKLSRLRVRVRLTGPPRLSVLLGVDTKFFHSGKERCAINSQLHGSAISATDAPPAFGQRPYYLFALLPSVFLGNTGVVISQIGIFSSALSVFLDDT